MAVQKLVKKRTEKLTHLSVFEQLKNDPRLFKVHLSYAVLVLVVSIPSVKAIDPT